MFPTTYEDLTLDITYTGNAKANVRFKVIEEWIYEDSGDETVLSIPNAKHILNDRIADNRSIDGYCYFTDVLQNESASESKTYEVIKGVVLPQINASETFPTAVKLTIYVDAVQSNRANKIWGISSIPQ